MVPVASTERLDLLPFTAECARLAVTDRAGLAALIGARVPDDWPNPDLAGALPYFIDMLTTMPALSTWIALAVERRRGVLIGSGGFIALPDETGTVELGFGLVPAFFAQGYASEIARAMLTRAFADPTVKTVIGRCRPDNDASRRLLIRLGFDQGDTDEDGNRLWRLPAQAKASDTAACA